jgi:tripartite-type tricarboxylate transporter receptor subunit TctC
MCVLLLASVALPAQEAWPTRPVRFIVATSPGGGTDSYARLLAQALAEVLKQPFIVDNRPGSSGNIGAEIVAKAAPDGYTFLVSSNSPLVINPGLFRNLPYDAERDFAPVARGVISPNVFTAHPSLGAKTLPALVALGKREPGWVTYASAGPGSSSNLTVKMLEEASGARFVHVPYKGAGQAVVGLLRGESMFMVSDVNTVRPHVESRRVIALATTRRTPSLPGTPDLAEVGYPAIKSDLSFGVTAPAGTPVVTIRRLWAEITKSMKGPPLKERLEAQGMIPVFETPEEFGAVLKSERARYAEIIRRNRIVVE